jgi:hypothetical protein
VLTGRATSGALVNHAAGNSRAGHPPHPTACPNSPPSPRAPAPQVTTEILQRYLELEKKFFIGWLMGFSGGGAGPPRKLPPPQSGCVRPAGRPAGAPAGAATAGGPHTGAARFLASPRNPRPPLPPLPPRARLPRALPRRPLLPCQAGHRGRHRRVHQDDRGVRQEAGDLRQGEPRARFGVWGRGVGGSGAPARGAGFGRALFGGGVRAGVGVGVERALKTRRRPYSREGMGGVSARAGGCVASAGRRETRPTRSAAEPGQQP